MTRMKLSGVLTLLLTHCLNTAGALGQMPGYSGGGHPAAPAATQGATQLPLYATCQSEFAIPFSVDRRIAQPVEVHLYVSVDQGRNWKVQSRQPPNTRQFTFRAPGDGEYWFASRTLDGTQRSQSQATPQPELRVVVDTVKPQIEFTARPGEGGEVLTSWQLFDQNLLASSLKVEYQEGVGKPWKPVAIQLPKEDVVRTSYQGRMTWWPETRSPTINIRAEVRDRAGNLVVANRRLLLPALVAQRTPTGSGLTPRPSDPFARHRQPSEGAVPWPSDNQPSQLPPGGGVSELARQGNRFGSHPTALPRSATRQMTPTAHGSSEFRTQESHLPTQHLPTHQASTQFPGPSSRTAPSDAGTPTHVDPLPESAAGQPYSGELSSGLPPDRRSGVVSPATARTTPSPDVASMLPPGERPQMTRSTRFHLEYDVDAIGPSGVAEVQLWATADAGRTWRLWGTDDDLQSPFDVAVDEQGIFGFHVVVVGKNGMAGRRPRTGDLADIWVGVDTTLPTADLTAALYGEGSDTGRLLIQWRASDQYLDPRPITLSFSESPDGPWTVIVSALPNTGQFAWPADPQLPSAVYLKLEVRDEANNVATDQTDEPVQIDGLAPKARIRGIQPVQDMDRAAFRLPRRG